MFDRRALLEAFLIESEEKLAQMENVIVALEASHDAGDIREIFRLAHTLKGNAASVGLDGLTALAHAVEDLLVRLSDGSLEVTPDLVTVLLEAVDVLRDMLDDVRMKRHGAHPDGAALVSEIQSIAQGSAARGSARELEPEDDEDSPPTVQSANLVSSDGRATAKADPHARPRGTLRVEVAKLDRILELTGEMAVLRKRLAKRLAGSDSETEEILRTEDRLLVELQEKILAARMLPVDSLFHQFSRPVRDLARACGKRARVVFSGGEVEVDMAILDELHDPLLHMIRNAVDHGIEAPEVRSARGKDPCGTIALSAQREGGRSFLIRVSDDGAGLDRERILERARQRGNVGAVPHPCPPAAGEGDRDRELFRLVLEAGFTTASVVTDRSGRGIGLDVVRQAVVALGGTIGLSDTVGGGFALTLRLPMTVAMLRGFGVEAAGQAFVLPMDAIVECVEFGESDRRAASGIVEVRGEAVPFVRLRAWFDLHGDDEARESLVIVEHGGVRAGIVVDALKGESLAVVKPLGKLFGDGVASSSTIMEDGGVGLVLDMAALVARALRKPHESLETLETLEPHRAAVRR